MYSLKTAFVRPRSLPTSWVEADVSALSIAQISETYQRGWLQLTHSILPGEYLLDLTDLYARSEDPTQTVGAFLIANDNRSLPTVAGTGAVKTRRSHYHDLYRTDLTIGALSEDTMTQEPKFEDNNWLTLASKTIEPKTIYENYLVSVNGLLHRTDYDTNVLYVEDATNSPQVFQDRGVGLHHMGSIGKLSIYPITADMIDHREDISLYEFTTLKLPAVDLSKYTVAISIGGFLHLADPKVVSRFGQDRLQINWPGIPLVQRIMDTRLRLNLERLELVKAMDNERLLEIEDVRSDKTLINYLTLSQSFLILIENPDVSVRVTPATKGPYYNQYLSTVPCNLSLISERGYFLEYWGIEELGNWSYLVPDPTVLNWRYHRTNKAEVNFATDGTVVAKPGYAKRKPEAFFFEAYSTQMVATFEGKDTVLQ